jgi:hypothetical protein
VQAGRSNRPVVLLHNAVFHEEPGMYLANARKRAHAIALAYAGRCVLVECADAGSTSCNFFAISRYNWTCDVNRVSVSVYRSDERNRIRIRSRNARPQGYSRGLAPSATRHRYSVEHSGAATTCLRHTKANKNEGSMKTRFKLRSPSAAAGERWCDVM